MDDTRLFEGGRYSSGTSTQPFHPTRDAVCRLPLAWPGELTARLRVMRRSRMALEALESVPDRVRADVDCTMETSLVEGDT
jgi:hypothetical protein